MSAASSITVQKATWVAVCKAADVPENGGVCALVNGEQIAIYQFNRLNKWYATQNECPHKQQMALSRGMIGTHGHEPKVACPFHKKTFSLESGACLSGDDFTIKTYPIKVENGQVFIEI